MQQLKYVPFCCMCYRDGKKRWVVRAESRPFPSSVRTRSGDMSCWPRCPRESSYSSRRCSGNARKPVCKRIHVNSISVTHRARHRLTRFVSLIEQNSFKPNLTFNQESFLLVRPSVGSKFFEESSLVSLYKCKHTYNHVVTLLPRTSGIDQHVHHRNSSLRKVKLYTKK